MLGGGELLLLLARLLNLELHLLPLELRQRLLHGSNATDILLLDGVYLGLQRHVVGGRGPLESFQKHGSGLVCKDECEKATVSVEEYDLAAVRELDELADHADALLVIGADSMQREGADSTTVMIKYTCVCSYV